MNATETPMQAQGRRESGNGELREQEARQQAHSLGALFKTLAEEAQALTKAEAELIRAEVNEKVSQVQTGITSMAAGVAVLAGGVIMLLLAAVYGLDLVLPLWASALIVGAVATLIAAAMVFAGKRKLEADKLKPKRSIHEARQTQQFAKELTR